MRWSRGLFRLWAVLSVAWIAGSFFAAYNEWPKRPNIFAVYDKRFVCLASATKGGIFYDVIPEKPDYEKRQACAEVEYIEKRANFIWSHLAFAFGVPTFLFVVGFSLIWALRGFRPDAVQKAG